MVAAGVVLVAAIGAAIGWSVRTLTGASGAPAEQPPVATYTVVEGTVGRSVGMGVTTTWPVAERRQVHAEGVLTTVAVASGDQVSSGQQIASVDLRPVVLAKGSVPAFRDLDQGASGPDVAQLQEMLAALRLYDGAVDAKYGPSTAAAVKTWQGQVGVARDGIVRLGDIIFVSSLPAVISLQNFGTIGQTLGGSATIDLVASSPNMAIELQDAQKDLVGVGTKVIVHVASGVDWTESVASVSSINGVWRATLSGPNGGPVCTDACGLVPLSDGSSSLPADVVVVPAVTGPTVPGAAVGTGVDGQAFVLDESGRRVSVTVKAAQGGVDVVDGVEIGQVIRLDPTAGASGR